MSANQIANGDTLASIRAKLNAQFAAGVPFMLTAKLSALTAGTIVHLVPQSLVGAGQSIHIVSMFLNVNGGTAWTDTTGTEILLQDTSAIPAITIPKSVLTGNAVISMANSSLTLANSVLQGTGLTVGAGLDLVADHNFASGSDVYVTVFGFIF